MSEGADGADGARPLTGKERLAAALGAHGRPATSSDMHPRPGTSRAQLRQGAGLDPRPPARVDKERDGRTGTESRRPGVVRVPGAGGVVRSSAPAFLEGDSQALMAAAEECSVDLIFTDPGIGGDGPGWVNGCPGQAFFEEMYRLAKPGAHLAIFSSRKYSHRVVSRAEDAGFEMRDTLLWIYPKGMPMAMDMGQAVDKKLGGEGRAYFRTIGAGGEFDKTNPWYGWGTEIRPTWEPISILRRPCQGSVADNLLAWGTGAMNIDATRIEGEERDAIATYIPGGQGDAHGLALTKHQAVVGKTSLGRWPADALFSHAGGCADDCVPECAVASLEAEYEGTAKFFYCPKADRREKDLGLGPKQNKAKGVKPVAVCRWVIQLLLPPGGVLLDPFMGTGSIGLGAIRLDGSSSDGPEGIRLAGSTYGRFVGMDVDPHMVAQAEARWLAYEALAGQAVRSG